MNPTQTPAADPAAVARAVLADHEVSDRFKALAAAHGPEIEAAVRKAGLSDWTPALAPHRTEAVTT